MASKGRNSNVADQLDPTSSDSPAVEPYPAMTEGIDEDFGDDQEEVGSDESNGVPASESAAALVAAVPPAVAGRKSDGKKAIAVRLNPQQGKRVRVRALIEGVSPSDLIVGLIDKYVKEVVITDKE